MLGAGQVGGSREDVEMKSNYILQFQHILYIARVCWAGRGVGVVWSTLAWCTGAGALELQTVEML